MGDNIIYSIIQYCSYRSYFIPTKSLEFISKLLQKYYKNHNGEVQVVMYTNITQAQTTKDNVSLQTTCKDNKNKKDKSKNN